MELPEIFLSWTFWYLVGGSIVVVAAVLLVAILLVARSIEREARRALGAAREIEANARSIRSLAGALDALESIHRRARGVAGSTAALAETLHGTPAGGTEGEGRTP